MTGVPAAQAHSQQQQDAATAANRSQALAVKGGCGQQSPEQARKLAAAANSYFRIEVRHAQGEPAPLLYKNSRALVDLNRILVVTRLARAALQLSPVAEQ